MTPPPDGKKSVDFLIKKGDLEMVEANLEGALRLFDQSAAHLRSASQILDGDPGGSFQLAYDAARKSLARAGCGCRVSSASPFRQGCGGWS
jgi:hypothetical protein